MCWNSHKKRRDSVSLEKVASFKEVLPSLLTLPSRIKPITNFTYSPVQLLSPAPPSSIPFISFLLSPFPGQFCFRHYAKDWQPEDIGEIVSAFEEMRGKRFDNKGTGRGRSCPCEAWSHSIGETLSKKKKKRACDYKYKTRHESEHLLRMRKPITTNYWTRGWWGCRSWRSLSAMPRTVNWKRFLIANWLALCCSPL